MRHLVPICAVLAITVSGCAGAATSPAPVDEKPKHKPVESLLVVDGKRISGGSAAHGEPRRADVPAIPARGPVLGALARAVPHDPWRAPALLPDGTIDASSETPFTDQPLELQPNPIEDDATTTLAIDAWGETLRRMDVGRWQQLTGNGATSPWARTQDTTMGHIVRIAVQRCGGARTVATGVVVARETVVTTVHGIESAALRVRVSPAVGEPAFIPAMVRYLDVDDDVAVLKVPGLQLEPIDFHAPDGSQPEWGYAYGVSQGSIAGTLRRSPAIVAMEEASLTVGQHDGFARQITDRSVYPIVAAIDAGFSGGVVTATNAPGGTTGWELHGMVRARVPFRALTAGIVVPARILREAVTASAALPEWFEHRPGGCPQWHR